MKKGDRVRVVNEDDEAQGIEIVGTIAKNQRHLPHPFYVDVDLEASKLSDELRAWYEDRYAGPFNEDQLEVQP